MDSHRTKLPKTRTGKTHKFSIFWNDEARPEGARARTSEYYITCNTYADGRPGEVFVRASQMDDAMFDQFCRSLSVNLQCQVPLKDIAHLFCGAKFLPAGMTDNPRIPTAHSPVDYLARWLLSEFGDEDLKKQWGVQ